MKNQASLSSFMPFSTIPLDQLGKPDLVIAPSAQEIHSAMQQEFKSWWVQNGFVAERCEEAILAIKLLEVIAEREEKLRKHVNDVAQSVLLATAIDKNLEAITAIYGVEREPGESDERLRQRALLSLEGHNTSCSTKAYIFHALTTDARIKEASAVSLHPGEVSLVILPHLSEDGSLREEEEITEMLQSVNARFELDNSKPLTDKLYVKMAQIIPYTLNVNLTLYPHYSSIMIQEAVESSLQIYVREAYQLKRSIQYAAILGAIYQKGIKDIVVRIKIGFPGKNTKEGIKELINPTDIFSLAYNQAAFCNSCRPVPDKITPDLNPFDRSAYGIHVEVVEEKGKP